MKVFFSWSGQRSQAVATELAPWVKKVVQSVEYWISTDMERGVRWLAEVNKNLDVHSFGILCVTPENVSAPWLNYEAGALAKHLGNEGRVIPYLLDFKSAGDLTEPLAQFNACVANRDGTLALIKTLNMHADFAQNEDSLEEAFELWWPRLDAKLQEISSSSNQAPARRDTDDKVDELLELTRDMVRSGMANSASILEMAEQRAYERMIDYDQRFGRPLTRREQDNFQQERRYMDAVREVTDARIGKKETRGLTIDWRPDDIPVITLPKPIPDELREEISNEIELKTGIAPMIVTRQSLGSAGAAD